MDLRSPATGLTTSAGDFDSDLLPLSSNGGDPRRQSGASEDDSQNEAEEDLNLFIDEEIVAQDDEEEEDGEDLYPDNFMEQCVPSSFFPCLANFPLRMAIDGVDAFGMYNGMLILWCVWCLECVMRVMVCNVCLEPLPLRVYLGFEDGMDIFGMCNTF